MKKTLVLLCVSMLFCCSYAQGKKVALIIGNGKYSEYFWPLRTPANDARAMDWSLQKLGYETIVDSNLNRDKMTLALTKFQEKAKGADVALFYYSGHGGYTTSKEKYFLVPSGKYINSATLSAECYDFDAVKKVMEATGAKLKLFFIDACRSPLDGLKGRKSFTPKTVLKEEERGTAYFFGTSETTAAFVGNGEFSVFTQSLLNHIGDLGYFEDVWKSITNEVVSQYKEQKPEQIVSKDFTDFRFNPERISYSGEEKHGRDLVSIKASPSSADIKINNESYGNSARVYLNYGGKYDIKITADGYETYKNSISLSPSPHSQRSFSYNLEKLEPATLTVSSNVSDASVYIDDKYLGEVYQSLATLSGTHHLSVEKKGYYKSTKTLNMKQGENREYVHLYRDYPWFFEAVNAYDNSGIFRYHYSPEYQIGLSYLHRLSSTDGRFSIGGMLGTSWGAISQLKNKGTESVSQGANIDINTSVNIGGEPGVTINETRTEYISLRDLEYSDYVDPNHEAEHYKVNVLALGQLGYSPCKGITLDLGVGAAYHQDKYWMKEPYMIKKTYNINNLTGEISNVKEEYVKSGKSMTYKDKSEISLALRLGSFFFIPVDYGTRILLGGGYTYLPSNNKYSSWDACIGLCVDF